MKRPRHVTVVLVCSLEQARKYLDKYLPGATTKEVGHFLAVQHRGLDEMGVAGAESVCYVKNLPVRTVAMRPPL